MSDPVLTHEVVAGNDEPRAWLYFLHGIFGAGRNWATVARRVTEAKPGWGAVLVDLREHGGSRGFAAPHTLASAASDLTRLEKAVDRPATAVLGHSFGGKVALRWSLDATSLRQVWLIDSTPQAGEPSGSAWRMLDVLRALPDVFDSRADAVAALETNGFDTQVAQWMATNLERHGEQLRWRFETDAIEALLRDFFRTDLWNAVEEPAPDVEVHVVKASQSSVLSGEPLDRMERIASGSDRVHLHTLEGGHWVHADSPQDVIDLLVRLLPDGG
jgi:pimeloyl-ACP methyl ester carboxylesterase